MIRIFSNWYLPPHLETVGLLMVGILLQIMDGSPFTMKESWQVVWETDLPSNHFTPFGEKLIKTLLSVIVAVRCTTTYAYVVSAMLVIFCIFKRSAPKLMCLWLLVSSVKPITMIFLEGLIGVYVCSAFGKIRKACMEFFIVKALELIFSTFLWGSVLGIYKDIEKELELKKIRREEGLLSKKQDFRRLRARSLIDESTLSKTTHFNNFERRDVPLLILQMLKRDEEMSDDSLLAPGMMLTSVSNLGSFDNIKTSQSLGELGFTDLTNAEVFGIEDNENLSKQEKVLKFLKMTSSEVRNIIMNKSSVGNDIYNVGEDIWKRVITSGMHVNQPKQPRTEIFLRKISPTDLGDEELQPLHGGLRHSLPFRSILSLLFNEKKDKEEGVDDDDSQDITSQDEEDQMDNIFMSNLKDGGPINRIKMGPSFKKFKGTQYANLYKKDFMSVIGPEVFDKASKLPQLTSLTKIRAITSRPPRSSPDLTKRKSKRLRTFDQQDFARSSHIYTHHERPAFSSAWESLPNVSFHDSSEHIVHPKDNKHMISFLIRSEEELAENSDITLEFAAHEAYKAKDGNGSDETPVLKPADEEEIAPVNLASETISQIKLPMGRKSDGKKSIESRMSVRKLSKQMSSIRRITEPKFSVRKLIEPEVLERLLAEAKLAEERAEQKLVEKKLTESKLVEKKLTEPKLVEKKITEPKLVEKKLTEPKLVEKKLTEPKLVEKKLTEPKLVEKKLTEPKLVEKKLTEPKLVEKKSTEPKLVEKKLTEPKAEEKLGEQKLKDKKPLKITQASSPDEEERTHAKEPSSANLPESENPERTKPINIYKNRKIMIRWVGQGKPKSLFRNRTAGNRSPSDDSDSLTDLPPKSALQANKEDLEKPQSSEKNSNSKKDESRTGVKKKKFKETDTKQIYYVSELFSKPLFDVLLNYYDLKKKVYLKGHGQHQKKEKMGFPKIKHGKSRLRETEKLLRSLGLEMRSEKNWKSEVLKRSEPRSQVFRTTSANFLNILNKKATLRKLLVREYQHLMQKYNRLKEAKTEDFGFTSPDEYNAETDPSEDSDISSETESDINTTDSAESCFVEGFLSSQPEEPKSDAPSPVLSELQPSDHLDAEEGDIQTSTTDASKPQTETHLETRAFHALANEVGELLSRQESDEPISLYYSKAANLASPLLDMKGFIYPDHIHYSYKHVKKKGFDVDINGGFPLLMRGSLTTGGSRVKREHKWEAKNQGCEIKRRPMDLSFAKTNAFAEWHSADQNDLDSITSETTLAAESYDSATEINSATDLVQNSKVKRENDSVERRDNQHTTKNGFKKAKPKSQQQNFSDLNYLYQSKDAALIEKLLKMHRKLNEEEYRRCKKNQPNMSNQQTPVEISSTQLHSNKGQLSPTHNTSTVLEEHRTINEEKKKSETQKERNKVMFARLEKEALLEKKVVLKSSGHTRKP